MATEHEVMVTVLILCGKWVQVESVKCKVDCGVSPFRSIQTMIQVLDVLFINNLFGICGANTLISLCRNIGHWTIH